MTRTGRKRSLAARTKSGRLSRAGAKDANHAPIMVRMRHHGLTEANARDQKAASFVGRLNLSGAITQQQYDASVEYLRIYGAYKRAIKAPDALRESGGISGDHGDSDSYDRWCKTVIAKYDAAVAAVQRNQDHLRGRANLFAALNYIVERDEEMPHMVSDCKLALSCLAAHFGLMGKGK